MTREKRPQVGSGRHDVRHAATLAKANGLVGPTNPKSFAPRSGGDGEGLLPGENLPDAVYARQPRVALGVLLEQVADPASLPP
jgi:hypothetical protein